MGRLRIKKKEAVIPFRETVAYRFILAGIGGIAFLIAAFQSIRSLQASNMTALAIAGAATAGAAIFAIYNLSRMQKAKVPRRTLERMKLKRGK